jgi:hypothetical protein
MSGFQERLEKSKQREKKVFNLQISYGDKNIFNANMDLPEYSEEILNTADFFFFLKELKTAIEDKINSEHKKKLFKKND